MRYISEYKKVLNLLLEAREDGLFKRFIPIIERNVSTLSKNVERHLWSTDTQTMAKNIILRILEADPDPKKSYSTWMCVLFTKGLLKTEDLPRFTDALAFYNECKKNGAIPRSHDIGSLKSYEELEDMLLRFKQVNGQVINKDYENEMFKQSNVLINNDKYLMLIPKTQEAAQWFGRNTEWCTAWGGEYGRHPDRKSLWSQYTNGPLYILQDKKTGDLWQFHKETGQYMDSRDRRIELEQFTKDHPEIVKWFIDQDLKNTEVYSYIGGIPVIKHKVNGYEAYKVGGSIGLNRKETEMVLVLVSVTGKPYKKMIHNESMSWEFKDRMMTGSNLKELCDFLNELSIGGKLGFSLTSLNLIYDPDKNIIAPFSEVAPIIISGKNKENVEYVWRGYPEEYRLYSDNVEHVRLIKRESYYESRYLEGGASRILDDLVEELLSLLLKLNDPDLTIYPHFDFDEITPEVTEIVKKFPNTVNIRLDLEINGKTSKFIERFVEEYKATINTKAFHNEGKISISRYDDIEELVDDIGNDTAKYILKMDERYVDYDGDVSTYKSDLFNSLSEEDDKKLLKFIVRESDDDDAKEDDYDTAEDAYNELGNDEIESILANAVSDGVRAGTENEAHSALWSAVDELDILYSKDNFESVSDKREYDTPCALMIDIDEVISWIEESDVFGDGWQDIENLMADHTNGILNVNEPYYGWDGFDEEHAIERFKDDLYEILNRADNDS